MISIQSQAHSIEMARAFRIARGARTHCDVVRVTLDYHGLQSEAECTPYPRYGESVTSVQEQIRQFSRTIEHLAPNVARQDLQQQPAGAARNALDCALWRLEAALADSHFPAPYFAISPNIETAMTVSVDTPSAMAEQASEYVASGASLLKIKLDEQQIIERLQAVRASVPSTKIIVDANEAWTHLDLADLFVRLAELDIAMIEQPVMKGEDERLRNIAHPVALCADESCHTRDDLPALTGCYEMINIKLDKSGGLTEALALEQAARGLGMSIMVGCMLGTSMAMKAALPLATRAEIVDLDGPVLLGQDCADGLQYHRGRLWI